MKKILFLTLFLISNFVLSQGRPNPFPRGITTPLIDTKGYTTAEIDAMTNVPDGRKLYDKDLNKWKSYNGSTDLWEVIGSGGSTYTPLSQFTVSQKVNSIFGLAPGNGGVIFEYAGTDVTNILFNAEYTEYLIGFNPLISTHNFYVKIFNKTKLKTLIGKITGFTSNDVSGTDYYSASIEIGDILAAEIDVADEIEVYISVSDKDYNSLINTPDLSNYVVKDLDNTFTGTNNTFEIGAGTLTIDNTATGFTGLMFRRNGTYVANMFSDSGNGFNISAAYGSGGIRIDGGSGGLTLGSAVSNNSGATILTLGDNAFLSKEAGNLLYAPIGGGSSPNAVTTPLDFTAADKIVVTNSTDKTVKESLAEVSDLGGINTPDKYFKDGNPIISKEATDTLLIGDLGGHWSKVKLQGNLEISPSVNPYNPVRQDQLDAATTELVSFHPNSPNKIKQIWDGNLAQWYAQFPYGSVIPDEVFGIITDSIPAPLTGSDIKLDTSEFDNNLTSADSTAQRAFKTLNDLIASGGADGADGVNGADGVVDGITLDAEFKQVLEFQSGLESPNLFNKNNLVDGYFSNNTNGTITAPITDEKISHKIWVTPGWYSLYNVYGSSGAGTYIKFFQPDGTYIFTHAQTSGSPKEFEVTQNGYIQFDVNRNTTASIDDIIFQKYDPDFSDTQNIAEYQIEENKVYNPSSDSMPNVVFEATDNVNDASKWIIGATPDYAAAAYIVIPTNGAEWVTVWDSWGLESFGNSARPQLVEYNVSDVEVQAQLTDDGEVSIKNPDNYKRWKLDPTTTYVHVLIPDGNTVAVGTLTRKKIQENIRITLGAYFTQETLPYRVKSINGKEVAQRQRHALFGKNIVLFGDSITTGTTGSVSSFSELWMTEYELTVFNHAVGSADLADNSDTTGVIDCDAITVNTENTISNQIGCFESKGIVPDIVLLTGGTNDANDGKSDGVLSTAKANYLTEASQDKETFYGILFWAVKTLRDLNPSVNITIMGAIDSVETANGLIFNAGLPQIRTAMQTTANELRCNYFSAQYLVPNIDGYGGVDTFIANDYFEDYLHPSVLAKETIMSPKILGELIKNNGL